MVDDFNPNRDRTMAGSGATASSLNVIAGLWLIISTFVLGVSNVTNLMWNNLIIGIVVLILAAIRASNPRQNVGLSWLNLLLGIWMIISPWVIGFLWLPGMVWHNVILGIIVGLLALWSALSVSSPPAARAV